jgi:hypothetical protein
MDLLKIIDPVAFGEIMISENRRRMPERKQ